MKNRPTDRRRRRRREAMRKSPGLPLAHRAFKGIGTRSWRGMGHLCGNPYAFQDAGRKAIQKKRERQRQSGMPIT